LRCLAVAPLVHRTVWWHTGQSGGTPDSPVNYSGAALLKPEGEEFGVDRPWCTGQSGAAPDKHCSLSGVLSAAALTSA
jgi:hypothetical protein